MISPGPAARLDPDLSALVGRDRHAVSDLARLDTLMELLGRPDQAYPAIHVAGSHGKSSVATMIAALIEPLGLVPGAATAPHLHHIGERFRIAGEPLPVGELAAALAYLEPFIREVDQRQPSLSVEEILTALAFVRFADAPVDLGVFEATRGGRTEPSTLARNEVAVLCAVAAGYEHAIKKGSVIISAAQPEPVASGIARVAAEHESRLVVANHDFAIADRELAVGGQQLTLRGVTGTFDDLYLPLHGVHQAENAACALAAVEGFLGFKGGLDPALVREGLARVRLPGRLEVVRRVDASTVILDGADDSRAAAAVASALRFEFALRHRVIVLGLAGDADVVGVVGALAPVATHVVVAPVAGGEPPARVMQAVQQAGPPAELAADVGTALEFASGVATIEDAVVVTGSMAAVAEARAALGLQPEPGSRA